MDFTAALSDVVRLNLSQICHLTVKQVLGMLSEDWYCAAPTNASGAEQFVGGEVQQVRSMAFPGVNDHQARRPGSHQQLPA
jgi:hypothetical protein